MRCLKHGMWHMHYNLILLAHVGASLWDVEDEDFDPL